MLSNISWSSYLSAVVIFAAVWYGFLIYKYYLGNLKNIFQGKMKQSFGEKDLKSKSGPFSEFKESFSTLEDAEELYDKLLTVFTESDAGGLSKAAFKNYIRFILLEYPFVKQSALRGKINSLVVLESAKYPELLLTLSEMDSLWEEEV
ncbi:hypothetical protein [Flavobacterium sp. ACN6]|uniref:hypothetical protein n=1 Tax=Flavobacterium sp. ACN6 TaxID=1920426 RepID=UPI001145075F|nr:hypothetical protein [Flavobacterium sp. ACN6]PBJ08035.1 hypothetical protein BSF42_37520 [Flavobacterium sp. ACN6]